MRAGTLRHRVEIQQPSDDRDEYGYGTGWTKYLDVSASVEPLSAMEYTQAAQADVVITHKVTLRYREGITRKMRVVFNERILDIESVINPEERNKQLILMCKEAV